MLKKILLSGLAVCAIGAVAIAQNFANLPIVGGASYSCGSVNATSNCTVPAGPALTGAETIPADTNVNNSTSPAVKLALPSLGAGLFTYGVNVTGDTVTATANTRQIVTNPAGTIAALTLVFPASTGLYHGQRLGFCSTQIITTLTITAGTGNTVTNGPTAMLVPVATGAASCVEFIYNRLTATTGTWYRTQ